MIRRSYLKKSISCIVTTCLTTGLLIPAVSVLADQAAEVSLDVFTDSVLRETLSGVDFDTDQDGILSGDEIAEIKDLAIHDGGINTTEGLENLTSLERLNLCGSNITEIDLSSFPNLNTLEIFDNPLTSLDLSGLSEMFYLDVHNTDITSLDVSDCPKIADAVAYGTYCEGPYTDSYCYGGSEGCVIFDQGVVFTTGIYQGTDETGTEETNEVTPIPDDPVDPIEINDEVFPDDNFRSFVSRYDSNNDGFLSADEIGQVYEIDCSDLSIGSLQGIEYFNELVVLKCQKNNITTLDLSNNPELYYLDCHDNKLTDVDFGDNNRLDWVSLGNNNLTSIDISNMSLLYVFDIRNNNITQLDITGIPRLILAVEYGDYDDYNSVYDYYGSGTGESGTLSLDPSVEIYIDGEMVNEPAGYGSVCAIDDETFPDGNFRGFVTGRFDTDEDGYLYEEEIAAITDLNLKEKNISSLTGIEYFTSLETLDCSNNTLTSLDLSANTGLKVLKCSSNKIDSLDLSVNADLNYLDCSNNKLTSLVLPANPGLSYVDCNNNQLTNIDLSNNTELEELNCSDNQLESLDLSQNTELLRLSCSGEGIWQWDPGTNSAIHIPSGMSIGRLDLSNNTKLQCLFANYSGLTSLVFGSSDLTAVYCKYNSLETLDISMLENIQDFTCVGNMITELDITNNEILILAYENGIYSDCCYEYHDSEAGKWYYFALDPEVKIYINGECVNEPEGLCTIDEESFPDETFRNYVLTNIDADGDQILSEEEAAEVTALYISEMGITTLKGIEYFTSLQYLYCADNSLTSLDVSANTELIELSCSGEGIWEEDSETNELVLIPSDMNIGSLDLTNNTKLERLYCASAGITDITIGEENSLTNIGCNSNLLTELDLSMCDAIENVECSGNEIADLDLGEGGSLTTLYCIGNPITELDLGSCSELTNLYCRENALTTLILPSSGKLEYLDCSWNMLDELDLDGQTGLLELKCSDNQITSIDASDSLELACMYVSDNQIKSIDISSNTALYSLDCNSNPLESLTIGNAPALNEIYCQNCGLTSIDVSGAPNLEWFKCSDNELTSLDISKNPDLCVLDCTGNNISTIDASNCHKLFGGVLCGVEPDVFEYREDASAGICGYWLENMSFQGFKFAYDIGTDVTCERWEKIDGKWYYYDMGTPVTGWKKIDNVWYYFDTSSGAMSTGWKKVSGKWYYFSGSGSMKTGWVLDGGEYYYFAGSGEMLTGWNKISKKWYYFAGSGEMLTGWQKIGDKFYYFEDSGAMVNGWKQISGKWYYLNDSGAMLTGWQKIADKWYYFEGSGSMVSGWKKISGKWYYFNGSGAMQTSKLTYKGKVYYFNSDGSCKNP